MRFQPFFFAGGRGGEPERGHEHERGHDREVPLPAMHGRHEDTAEHPAPGRYRARKSRMSDVDDDWVTRIRSEPLTFNRLIALFGAYMLINQGLNEYRERQATEQLEALGPLVTRIANLETSFTAMSTEVRGMKKIMEDESEGNWMFFYGICQQFKRNFERGASPNYPRLCNDPKIMRFEADAVTR